MSKRGQKRALVALLFIIGFMHVITYRTTRVTVSNQHISGRVKRPTLSPKLESSCKPLRTKLNKKKFRSQRKEDAELDQNIFKGRTGGIFLEIGGLDGLKFSNSWYFEQTLCWRGILIEGLPLNFQRMKVNRPLAVNIGRAVCDRPGTITYLVGDNVATAGLESYMDEGFKEKWHSSSSKVDVCCNPMSEILQATEVPYINLLSVDVEGAEELILRTVDWGNIPVEVVIVETDSRFMKADKVLKLSTYLRSKGFDVEKSMNIEHSTVFRNTSFVVDEIDVHDWSKKAIPAVSSALEVDCNLL